MAVPRPVQARATASSAVESYDAVDIAGTRWPLYKLEALVIALLTVLVLGLVTGSAQTAVLVGAAVGALLWVTGRYRAAHHNPHPYLRPKAGRPV